MNMSRIFYTCLTSLLLFTIVFCANAKDRIPFRLEGNLLLIKATINGQTGEFILDTGAPDLILNEARFKGIRVPWEDKNIADFHGHVSAVKYYAINQFSMGGLSFKKQYALTIDLSSVEKTKGIYLLGIIGYSILKELNMMFDFDRQELSFTRSRKKCKELLSDEIPQATFDLRFSGHIPFLIANVGKKKLRLGIDTGAEINILDNRALKHTSTHFDQTKKLKVKVKGVGHHQKTANAGTLQNLHIHGHPVGPIDVTLISIRPLNESLSVALNGLLGIPFLKRGKVGIDYKKRKLYLWKPDGQLANNQPEEGLEVLVEGEGQ
ncbi:MAG TPA: hypothetical protein ENJ95_05510 [Bacteroidetes bacterium]|nr:hypothetical protein [Bacteroidota bacterium]